MGSLGRIYNNTSFFLQEHARKLAQLNEQAASGARVNRASDAPSDAYNILRLRGQLESLQTYSKNIDDVIGTLRMSYGALDEISAGAIKVGGLLTQAISGTYDPNARRAIAEEIDSLLEQMLSLGNTKTLGRYIFGGTNTSKAPFAAQRVGGRAVAVDYRGTLDNLPVPVAPGVEYPGLIVGYQTFWANDRQTPEFLGDTGATAGTATSSVRGDVYLAVTHTQTAYAGGTGIAAGTDSPEGDTILGDHVLTVMVNGATKTLSLDGGVPVAFEGTEQNLRVASSAGDVVYVNVENWSGFEGDVAVTATGKLSIDDGASFTDLTSFTDNVAVADAHTGRVLYVNAAQIRRTGTEPIRVPGTYDLFATLINIRDLVLNERGLPLDRQQELMTRSLESLEEVSGVLRQNMASVGGRSQALDMLKESLEGIQATAGEQAAMLEQADIVQVAIDLARTQTLYEMSLAVASRLLRLSLLDFI